MYMAGVSSEEDLKQARDVLIPLGEYFQIQAYLTILTANKRTTSSTVTEIQRL